MTRLLAAARSRAFGFNPRPCVRGDDFVSRASRLTQEFQSTPLREGRLSGRHVWSHATSFNPRPCVRGDGACRARADEPMFNPRPCVRGDV